MPTARSIAYSVPSGGAVYAGARALNLVGDLWTPNRQANDEVLITDYGQFPANTWIKVNGVNNKLRSQEALPFYPNSGSGNSFSSIIKAWSGAAWNSVDEAIMPAGSGGHTDVSAAENGVYAASAKTMRVTTVVPRQAAATALKKPAVLPGGQDDWTDLEAGEAFLGGTNLPLSNGVPGSNHSAGMVEYLPPAQMVSLGYTGNTKGGIWLGGLCQALLNLQDGTYSQPHYIQGPYPASNVTQGYESSLMHFMRDPASDKLFGIRSGSAPWMTLDLAQTEMTLWQLCPQCSNPAVPSLGKYLANNSNSGLATSISWALIAKLTARREMVFFQSTFADYTAKRVRLGEAVDASATDYSAYTDTITLTSDNATDHLDFKAANFKGYYGHNLNHAGSFYDTIDDVLWVCANDPFEGTYDAGGSTFTPGTTLSLGVYKLFGATTGSLDDSTWKVKKLPAQPLTVSPNGTWGRFAVVKRGAHNIGLRLSDVDNELEVVRLVA